MQQQQRKPHQARVMSDDVLHPDNSQNALNSICGVKNMSVDKE